MEEGGGCYFIRIGPHAHLSPGGDIERSLYNSGSQLTMNCTVGVYQRRFPGDGWRQKIIIIQELWKTNSLQSCLN